MVGAPRALERFMLEFVQPQSGDRILDMGCGAGQLAAHLPDGVGYVGLDISAEYIASAKSQHPEHVFHCATIGTDDLSELNLGSFDHVSPPLAFCTTLTMALRSNYSPSRSLF